MSNLTCWLQSSLSRVYPGSAPKSSDSIDLLAARNERISFQACIHNPTESAAEVEIAVEVPAELGHLVRRVGYVPMPHVNTGTDASEIEGIGHIPGFVPDPLFPVGPDSDPRTLVGPFETQSFWITIGSCAGITPGMKEVKVRFTVDEEALPEMTARVDISEVVLQPRRNFPATHWFYADALCDWYKINLWEERFWELLPAYVRNMVEHGINCLYVPIFTPPTDGVKRPTQLLKVTEPEPGRYEFDFSDVLRWVKVGEECGAEYFEWTHFISQWGAQYALRIYRDNLDPESLLWDPETEAVSNTYRNFLAQFLPAFKAFLDENKLMERSFFHVSDEPHGDEHLDNYRRARAMLKELAPWMRVMDALSDIRYGKEGLTDMPIPSIGAWKAYAEEGIRSWVYYCCGPRGKYVQRLMDTPLAKIRMNGWLFYKLDAKGFLHWGHNYWHKSQTQQLIDPFTESSGCAWPGWAYGDTFVVYPGSDGPIDSIRWEIFGESMQDYALLQTVGIKLDDPLLAEIEGYDEFPKCEEWIARARRIILKGK